MTKITRETDYSYSENSLYRAKWLIDGVTIANAWVNSRGNVQTLRGIELTFDDNGIDVYRRFYNIPAKKMIGILAAIH